MGAIRIAVLGLALAAPGLALAQAQFPSKPVRIVVTLAAGSAGDILSRVLADPLSRSTGQNFIVDNRPGAGGNVAGEIVAKSPPDGYNLFLTTISTHGINPSLYSKMPFDPIRDFAPIVLCASSPNVLVVHPSMPVANVKQLIALAKTKPGELTFSSGGSGTSQHMSGELFSLMAGVKMTHVPYKGTPQSVTAVMSGEIAMSFASVPVAASSAKAGKLKALGVTSAKRVAAWPDMVTIAESGLPGFDVAAWFGYAAPAGTPDPIIRRLNDEFRKALADPGVRDKLGQQGMEVLQSSPEEFAAYIKSEIAKWAKVVKASGAKAD
jgi:tripartite-type tricarboxylate transporter receptor subunit TctC